MDDLISRLDAPQMDPRVDELFATAMEHQLTEQRTLTRLATRVETALGDLQRGIAQLTEHVGSMGTAAPVASDDAVLQALSRLADGDEVSRRVLLEGLDGLRTQLDLSGLRREIGELATRVDQGTGSLPGTLDSLRTTLRTILDRIDQRGGASQDELDGRLASLAEHLEARLAEGNEEAGRALVSAQRTLNDQAVRLETVRETLQSQAGHATERVAALLDHATANQREVLAALSGAASQLATEAVNAREAVGSHTDDVRAALTQALQAAQAGLDRTLAAARSIGDQLSTTGASSAQAVERLQDLLHALTTQVEQAQTQSADRLARSAAMLDRAVGGIEPAAMAAVEQLRQSLQETAEAERAESSAAMSSIRESAAGTVEELRSVVDDVSRRLLEAHDGGVAEMSAAAGQVVRAADELQPAFSSALAKLYGAVAAAATQVQSTTDRTLRGVEASIAETQVAAVGRLERAAETLEHQSTTLHPALTEAADDLRRALLDAAAEDRARTEVSLAAVQRAADEAIERLSAAVASASHRVAEQHGTDTALLAEAADHVARTAESLAPAVNASIAQVDQSVNDALRSVQDGLADRLSQSDQVAQAVANKVRVAADDSQDRLRVWLAGALPDAVAQITSGLTEQLERAETRLDETASRIEAGTEGATDRMSEAARALTAVAGENVGNSERRLLMLNEQIDALIERLDVVADAEGRQADAADALLAKVGERDGPAVTAAAAAGLTPKDMDALAARVEETLTRGLTRLESQLAGFLRDRDRVVTSERERLVAELAERLGPAARKEANRLLGGLLTSSGRRREYEPPGPSAPPPQVPPLRRPDLPPSAAGSSRQAVRPPDPTHACEICGFVARSPGGLSAHRRTHDE